MLSLVREMGLVQPLWRSVQHEEHVTTVSAVSHTSCHYLGRLTKAGSNTPEEMHSKASSNSTRFLILVLLRLTCFVPLESSFKCSCCKYKKRRKVYNSS